MKVHESWVAIDQGAKGTCSAAWPSWGRELKEGQIRATSLDV